MATSLQLNAIYLLFLPVSGEWHVALYTSRSLYASPTVHLRLPDPASVWAFRPVPDRIDRSTTLRAAILQIGDPSTQWPSYPEPRLRNLLAVAPQVRNRTAVQGLTDFAEKKMALLVLGILFPPEAFGMLVGLETLALE